ncbi:MAG: alpha/beta fold hydrolase [Magnetococcales bacterium]|nr:alpha/beta fold hydrolase [Magnetococcales bacterium]
MNAKPSIHWEERGHGSPLLCLAGFGNAHWVFDHLAEHLGNHFRLILPDNRGMGRSPPALLPYELHDLANDSLALMNHLGHKRFAVMGLSMGGFIAQLLTLAAPDQVERLLLLCTSSGGADFREIFPMPSANQVQSLYQLNPEEQVRAALSPLVMPILPRYPEVFDYLMQQRTRAAEKPDQILLQFLAVAHFMEQTLPLETIRCPTLLLSGDQDPIVPPANTHRLGERLPNARIHIFEETDHLFFLEKTAEVATVITGFLTAPAMGNAAIL